MMKKFEFVSYNNGVRRERALQLGISKKKLGLHVQCTRTKASVFSSSVSLFQFSFWFLCFGFDLIFESYEDKDGLFAPTGPTALDAIKDL